MEGVAGSLLPRRMMMRYGFAETPRQSYFVKIEEQRDKRSYRTRYEVSFRLEGLILPYGLRT